MRKGFIHIVEVIIIILTIFVIIFQFNFIPRIDTDFTKTKHFLQANDIVHSLEARGIDWFDKAVIENEIKSLLPTTAEVSLKIRNVIKSSINIGCYCNSTDFNNIRSALTGFTVNDRLISFNITDLDHTSDPLTFPLNYDVIILGSGVFDQNPNPSLVPYSNRMLAFMRNGHGIVEITDFNGVSKVGAAQNNIFGVEYNASLTTDPINDLYFTKTLRESSQFGLKIRADEFYYNIYKNYYALPIFNDSFTEPNGPPGNWNIITGNWQVNNNEYEVNCAVGDCFSFAGSQLWDDEYVFEANFYVPPAGFAGGFGFKVESNDTADNGIWYIINTTDQTHFYIFYDGASGMWDVPNTLNTLPSTFENDKWYKIRIKSTIDTPSTTYTAEVLDSDGRFFFNLTEDVTIGSPGNSGAIGFYRSPESGGQAKFDNVRIKSLETQVFDTFLNTNEKITQTDYPKEDRTVVFQPAPDRTAAAIVNQFISDGKGRTAWISAGNENREEKKLLVKDLVLWAAGDEMEIIRGDVKNPTKASLFKVVNKDTFEVMEIVFSMGKIFQ